MVLISAPEYPLKSVDVVDAEIETHARGAVHARADIAYREAPARAVDRLTDPAGLDGCRRLDIAGVEAQDVADEKTAAALCFGCRHGLGRFERMCHRFLDQHRLASFKQSADDIAMQRVGQRDDIGVDAAARQRILDRAAIGGAESLGNRLADRLGEIDHGGKRGDVALGDGHGMELAHETRADQTDLQFRHAFNLRVWRGTAARLKREGHHHAKTCARDRSGTRNTRSPMAQLHVGSVRTRNVSLAPFSRTMTFSLPSRSTA